MEEEKIDNSRKFKDKLKFSTILVHLIENNEIRFYIESDRRFLNIKLIFNGHLNKLYNIIMF